MVIDLEVIFGEAMKKRRPELEPTLQNIVATIYRDADGDHGPWIAGGMGRQLVLGQNDFADIDVWFRNQYQFDRTMKVLNDVFGYSMFENFSSDNAITYSVGDYKVQLIKRSFYSTVDDVFNNFDFTCCQVAVDRDLNFYGPGIDDAKNYVLKLHKFDGKAFLARYAKYVGYGYNMDPAEFIEIMERQDINYEFDGTTLGY